MDDDTSELTFLRWFVRKPDATQKWQKALDVNNVAIWIAGWVYDANNKLVLGTAASHALTNYSATEVDGSGVAWPDLDGISTTRAIWGPFPQNSNNDEDDKTTPVWKPWTYPRVNVTRWYSNAATTPIYIYCDNYRWIGASQILTITGTVQLLVAHKGPLEFLGLGNHELMRVTAVEDKRIRVERLHEGAAREAGVVGSQLVQVGTYDTGTVVSSYTDFLDADLNGANFSLLYNPSSNTFVKQSGTDMGGGTIKKLAYKGSGSLSLVSTYKDYCVVHGANLGDVTITLPEIANIPAGTEFFFANLSTVTTPYIIYIITSGSDTIQALSGASPGVPVFYSESVHLIGYGTNLEVS